jgi:transcriptional regulator
LGTEASTIGTCGRSTESKRLPIAVHDRGRGFGSPVESPRNHRVHRPAALGSTRSGRTLYLPKRFENADLDRSLAVMRGAPLATLVSVDANHCPFVSHLPLVVEQRGESLVCIGHLARANPHSTLLAGQLATAIFHGPNAYITPNWYVENDVPTWNYAVVHARGHVSLIEDRRGIVECLEKLTAMVERGPDAWKFWIPDDLVDVLEQSIVGFTMPVEVLQAKFKLSQNRPEADRSRVIEGLATRADAGSLGIRALMKER